MKKIAYFIFILFGFCACGGSGGGGAPGVPLCENAISGPWPNEGVWTKYGFCPLSPLIDDNPILVQDEPEVPRIRLAWNGGFDYYKYRDYVAIWRNNILKASKVIADEGEMTYANTGKSIFPSQAEGYYFEYRHEGKIFNVEIVRAMAAFEYEGIYYEENDGYFAIIRVF